MAAATAQGTYINPMAALATQIPHATLNGMANSVVPPTSGNSLSLLVFHVYSLKIFLTQMLVQVLDRDSPSTAPYRVYLPPPCPLLIWRHKRQMDNPEVLKPYIRTASHRRIQLVSSFHYSKADCSLLLKNCLLVTSFDLRVIIRSNSLKDQNQLPIEQLFKKKQFNYSTRMFNNNLTFFMYSKFLTKYIK